ncbi:MAG: recombinase family protein, partial [Hyphomicrobiales bacterium]
HIGVLFDEAEGWGVKFEFVTERFEDTAIGRFILAARAFTAEVEREKIAERTMRGKAERARAGKIPQATGKGIYGYRYDPTTGRREIDAVQATVVRRIFAAFCTGAGCSRVAGDLNRDGIPALGGGIWHPLTVRRVLMNETYTGRTVYRRTKVTAVRDPRTGRKRRRVTVRDESEWIEVEDATPPIIARGTWETAQALLAAPERQMRGQPTHEYLLRGHVRCGACGTPMVGQSMQKGRYRYYRCRRSFSGGFEGKCESTYVRGDSLEGAVREEIIRVLADPAIILRQAVAQQAPAEMTDLDGEAERQLAEVIDQQKRLARLYVTGSLPDEVLASETDRLAVERNRLEAVLQVAARPAPTRPAPTITDVLHAVGVLREWLAAAGEDDFRLMLQALDVTVTAAPDEAEIRGSIPSLERSPDSICRDEILTTVRTSA